MILLIGGRALGYEPAEHELKLRAPRTSSLACSADSLYLCLRLNGVSDAALSALDSELLPNSRGVSLADILSACHRRSIVAHAIRTDLDGLQKIESPTILYVNRHHFVTFLGTFGGRMQVFDNSYGLYECTPEWFANAYTWEGMALVVGPLPVSFCVRLYGSYFCLGLAVATLLLVGWAVYKRHCSGSPSSGGKGQNREACLVSIRTGP